MTTYYVGKTGSDNNSPTQAQNPATPRLTINSGLTLLSAGDTLIVQSGTYNETLNNTIPSGNPGNPTIVKSEFQYGAIIQPTSFISGLYIIIINGITHDIILDGFMISGVNNTNVTGHIVTDGTAHDILIRNNEIAYAIDSYTFSPSQGIGTGFGNYNLTFRRNKIHDIGLSTPHTLQPGQVGYSYGTYFHSSNCLWEYNEIYNNSGHGIHYYNDQSNPDSQRTHDNVFRYNIVHDNGSRGILMSGTDSDTCYGNIVYRNGFNFDSVSGTGIQAGGYGGTNTNLSVYNNTIWSNHGYCIGIGANSSIARNNICYQNDIEGITFFPGTTGNVQDHNLIGTNPLFVNIASRDFHLQSSSPAIGFGTVISTTITDFDGNLRTPINDAGAYQFTVTPTNITCDDLLPWVLVSSGTFSNDSILKSVTFSIHPARWVCFRPLSDVNGSGFASCAELGVLVNGVSLPVNILTLWCFDSQELVNINGAAVNCIDGNINTFWHTPFTGNYPLFPHNIVIDLGTVYPVNGFTYLPRQDGSSGGRIATFEFYTADYWIMPGRVMKLPLMQPLFAM